MHSPGRIQMLHVISIDDKSRGILVEGSALESPVGEALGTADGGRSVGKEVGKDSTGFDRGMLLGLALGDRVGADGAA
jgi:hypothetical protein